MSAQTPAVLNNLRHCNHKQCHNGTQNEKAGGWLVKKIAPAGETAQEGMVTVGEGQQVNECPAASSPMGSARGRHLIYILPDGFPIPC